MSSARASVFDMAWWPNGMEMQCPTASAVAGCRWVTATARSTTPTLTNNLIIVNHRANGLRTAIPFGRETQTLTSECGQRRMRQAVAREGGHAKRNPKLARERAIEKGTLPSPHTLARRRFRLARKCPAAPTMRCHRQGQAFSVWRDGQTEWRCGVRWRLRVRAIVG